MSTSVAVKIVRPMFYKGRSHYPGEVFVVSPLEAFNLTSTNRAELATAADRATVQAAGAAERDRLIAKCGRRDWPVARGDSWFPIR